MCTVYKIAKLLENKVDFNKVKIVIFKVVYWQSYTRICMLILIHKKTNKAGKRELIYYLH